MKIIKRRGIVEKDKKEALKPVNDRKVGKRKAAVKADKTNTLKSKKKTSTYKDPNKPKRPPSAFFVFLEDFRKTFKQEHPTVKAVSAVGKAAGEKWKSMSSVVSTQASFNYPNEAIFVNFHIIVAAEAELAT
ncbi:hypothetical protein AQUCO_00400335v1 [Aquilegia coerulea]|uniref:HMG box domain-containing protein n=1 Tax=Aquilegia coerulea TaxID=218851 RepID=A0A2G5EUI1_AQUCA|nr:hypothetical protein AQUCO_00400335v1 [Aquilegia coerulea]PIA59384.1 hypothetical protein AQUCO_00400335v1 [Aquilegia coerulea]